MEMPEIPKFTGFKPTQFIGEVQSELKKVSWPTKNETIKLTLIVIIISVMVAVFIGGSDAVFLQLSTLLWR